jgi:hypothetical protein
MPKDCVAFRRLGASGNPRDEPHSQSIWVQVPLVGQPVGWLLTGVGRAYLAFCSAKEREPVLQRLRKSKKADDHLSHDPKRLDKILLETRQRGYGTQDPTFFGGGYGAPPLHDGLAAIAVPITDGHRVYGSMNILWIKTAFTTEAFADRHLGELQAAARERSSLITRLEMQYFITQLRERKKLVSAAHGSGGQISRRVRLWPCTVPLWRVDIIRKRAMRPPRPSALRSSARSYFHRAS